MKFLSVFSIILFFLVPFFAFAENPRHALVIGNGSYRHVEALPNTANDARDIAAKLTDMGYTVICALTAIWPAWAGQ